MEKTFFSYTYGYNYSMGTYINDRHTQYIKDEHSK
jgi:hypothetical protein